MQFLRSIKSVKALGLAAATAATMVTANVAPSMAQTPATASIGYYNQAGYNTRFFVTSPTQRTFDSGLRMLGQGASTRYPVGTTVTIVVRREDNQRVVLQKAFTLRSNVCVKAFGTVFNPSAEVRPGTC